MEVIQIFWHCADDDGNLNFHDINADIVEFVADLSTGTLYSDYDDIGHIDDPYFFTATGLSNFISEQIREDSSFVTDELSEKHFISALNKQITEPDLTGTNILRLHKWVKPHHGEITLIYEVDSFRCNHPMDPEEWEMNINCLGSLNDNYSLVENSDISKKSVNDIYLKLVEMNFNLQDPIESTLEDATKDMDNVLKQLEILLKIKQDD